MSIMVGRAAFIRMFGMDGPDGLSRNLEVREKGIYIPAQSAEVGYPADGQGTPTDPSCVNSGKLVLKFPFAFERLKPFVDRHGLHAKVDAFELSEFVRRHDLEDAREKAQHLWTIVSGVLLIRARIKSAHEEQEHSTEKSILRNLLDQFDELMPDPDGLAAAFGKPPVEAIDKERYPIELRTALEVFEAVKADPSATAGHSPRRALRAWLDENKPNLTAGARARIATVANWAPQGGAPATPNGSPDTEKMTGG